MSDLLKRIIESKKRELEAKIKQTDPEELKEFTNIKSDHPSDFTQRLLAPSIGTIGLIAEVKLKSPSNGDMTSELSVTNRAIQYNQAGADAISVVTDKEFFNGDIDMIRQIKHVVQLPILQKDFVIDFHQVYEAKHAGSDALLLIAKILDSDTLKWFVELCFKLQVEPVVEINTNAELVKALASSARIISVNARNLDTLEIDLEAAYSLCKDVPKEKICLGFSGVQTRNEIERYQKAGAKGVLVGTVLMRSKNIAQTIRSLKGVI